MSFPNFPNFIFPAFRGRNSGARRRVQCGLPLKPGGRLLRGAKLCEIGARTSEIRRMLTGRELFAESR